jgi:hypothetical protein
VDEQVAAAKVEGYQNAENDLGMTVEEAKAKIEKEAELESQVAELTTKLAQLPHDPTYDELTEFIKEDQTEKLWATTPDHLWLAHVLINNAVVVKIKGYLVIASVKTGQLYFAGFRTTDQGVVYICTPIDKEVQLVIGESYSKINNLPSPGFDDTILQISLTE